MPVWSHDNPSSNPNRAPKHLKGCPLKVATFFICVGVGAPNNMEAWDLSLSLRPEGH